MVHSCPAKLSVLIVYFFASVVLANNSATFSTPQIIQDTISAVSSCLHYKVIGICFWQQCNASGCTVTTTPKVEHYLPDAVVSVYRQADSNPWDYAKTIVDSNAKQVGNTQIKTLLNYNMGIENDNNTQWQMVYPKQENQCVMFGTNDLAQAAPWEQDAAVLGNGITRE